jgi:hypothetical protein
VEACDVEEFVAEKMRGGLTIRFSAGEPITGRKGPPESVKAFTTEWLASMV